MWIISPLLSKYKVLRIKSVLLCSMQSLSVHAIEIVIIIDDVKFHLIPCIISVYNMYKM